MDKTLHDRLADKLTEISNIIIHECQNYKISDETGLYNGLCGCILFLHHYYSYTKRNDTESLILLVNKVFIKINQGKSLDLSFCEGLTGVYALLYYLSNNRLIGSDVFESQELDAALKKRAYYDLEQNNYDLFYGVCGYLYYLFFKYSHKKTIQVEKEILDIIQILSKRIQNNSEHLACFQNIKGRVGLGTAHGLPGILLILAKFHQAGLNIDIRILDNIALFIIPFVYKVRDNISYFPNIYDLGDIDTASRNSRLGWCYGDIGCAISLLEYSKITNNLSLYNSAMQIAISSTERKDLLENKIQDAGICHGSTGIAMLFNYLYTNYNDVRFKEYSDFFFEETLQFATHPHGYAGFCTMYKDEKRQNIYLKDLSLLTGISGIGLTFLSYLSDQNRSWEVFFLI